jgi:hypothetical protein
MLPVIHQPGILSIPPVEQPPSFTTTNLFNMKLILIPALLFSLVVQGQVYLDDIAPESSNTISPQQPVQVAGLKTKIKIGKKDRWRLDGNKLLTGGLVFTAGAAKGFNEGLQFNYGGFENIFPKANDQWFYPTLSFRNKYKDGDPSKGAKFPLSTSVLVMFTDQYHLNNFIQRASLTAALVIKIGEKKKPFRHYVFDALYYTACYQVGFHSMYYPIKTRNY